MTGRRFEPVAKKCFTGLSVRCVLSVNSRCIPSVSFGHAEHLNAGDRLCCASQSRHFTGPWAAPVS
eukprot:2761852-Pyramimonas_sp.AAC.1